jgi:hypothetical protein
LAIRVMMQTSARPSDTPRPEHVTAKTLDVFGIRQEPVASMIERSTVDPVFRDAVEGTKHIVLYGSSKQGKTSLREKWIAPGDCFVYRCSVGSSVGSLYRELLNDAGVRAELSQTVEGGWSLAVRDLRVESKQAKTSQALVGDVSDVGTVCRLLEQADYRRWIVIEEFHYLDEESQRALAFDLKILFDVGRRVLIVGVWQEDNFLSSFNGDLEERIVEVPVEPWKDDDLEAVLTKGAEELNCVVAPAAVKELVAACFGNVGLFQELCRAFFELSGVYEREPSSTPLTDSSKAEQAKKNKARQYAGAVKRSLRTLAHSSSRRGGNEGLFLPYYLCRLALAKSTKEWKSGVHRSEVQRWIKLNHETATEDRIRPTDIANLMHKLPSYQRKLQPPLFSYISGDSCLKIADARMFPVLQYGDVDELIAELPRPWEPLDGDDGAANDDPESDEDAPR